MVFHFRNNMGSKLPLPMAHFTFLKLNGESVPRAPGESLLIHNDSKEAPILPRAS